MTLLHTQPITTYSLWQVIRSKRIPLEFTMELTARCNNRCRHCYISKDSDDKEALKHEMQFSLITTIAEEAASLGSLWCTLTGGEPLLREDFSDIYIRLKKMGFLISILTNATMLTAEHISLFESYPPRNIEITVYGATKLTYEHVTQIPGSFDLFERGLRLLEDSSIGFQLKTVIMRSNYHEAQRIFEFCRKKTREIFRFDPILSLRLDHNQIKNSCIKDERLTADEIVALEKTDSIREAEITKICKGAKSLGSAKIIRCAAGLSSFAISPIGKYQFCQLLVHPATVYDLTKGSLKYAWEVFTPRIRSISSLNSGFLMNCARCPTVNLCRCCPANAYLEVGEMDLPADYFCDIAQARAISFNPVLK